jgi:hypothetical protein
MKRLIILVLILTVVGLMASFLPVKAEEGESFCWNVYDRCREEVMSSEAGFIKKALALQECDDFLVLCLWRQIFPHFPFIIY